MPERIDAAVLTGAGGAHLDAYFSALADTVEAEKVFVVDPSGASEERARQALGPKLARFERDAGKLLAQEKPALALISMEAVQSPPVIRAALEAGCHVFAEKPSCVRADDFAELVKLADSKHRLLMLALANRTRGTVLHAQKLIRSGAIGQLYGLELHIIADQTRLKSPAYHKAWFADKSRAGGGHLIWLGIHWLDLVMFLTGASISEVAAFTGNVGGQPITVEDSAAAILRFEPGFFGTITSGFYLDKGYHSHIKIWGSHGWLLLEPHGGTQLQWYSTKESDAPKVTVYDGPVDSANYTPMVRASVRAAAGLGEAPINGAESLRALKTVFACYRSAETRQVQRVNAPA